MMTTDELAAIRAQHEDDDGFCYRCSHAWPCDASTLLAALDAAQAEVAHMADVVAAARDVVLNWELLGRGVNTAGLVAMCERLARRMGATNE